MVGFAPLSLQLLERCYRKLLVVVICVSILAIFIAKNPLKIVTQQEFSSIMPLNQTEIICSKNPNDLKDQSRMSFTTNKSYWISHKRISVRSNNYWVLYNHIKVRCNILPFKYIIDIISRVLFSFHINHTEKLKVDKEKNISKRTYL